MTNCHRKEGMEWKSVKEFGELHHFKGKNEQALLNLESLSQALIFMEKYQPEIFRGEHQSWYFGLGKDYSTYDQEIFREATIFVYSLLLNKGYLDSLDQRTTRHVLKIAHQYLVWALQSRLLYSKIHPVWMDAYNTLCQKQAEIDKQALNDESMQQLNELLKAIDQSTSTSYAFALLRKQYRELRSNNFNTQICLRIVCALEMFF